jgi:GNAT superfamily N-acetyltransferase
MTSTQELRFEPAEEADITPITDIMVRAFDYYAHRHLGTPPKYPPGFTSGNWLREWFTTGIVYKILTNHTLIGTFIISRDLPKRHSNYLGPIFIDLPYRKQGIGSRTLEYIEFTFPAQRWHTMTPAWATQNARFYEKHGYTKTKETIDAQTRQLIYIYEKQMP